MTVGLPSSVTIESLLNGLAAVSLLLQYCNVNFAVRVLGVGRNGKSVLMLVVRLSYSPAHWHSPPTPSPSVIMEFLYYARRCMTKSL